MGVASTSGRTAFAPSLARRYGRVEMVFARAAEIFSTPFFLRSLLLVARCQAARPLFVLSEACVRLGAIGRLPLLFSVVPHASTQIRGCLLLLMANSA